MKDIVPRKPSTITVRVPMTFTVRGGRKTIISEAVAASPQPRVDNALLRALARAHRWRRKIEGGEYASITELAMAEGVNESYACRMLRLSLLAPRIVTAILDGRHGCDVMLKRHRSAWAKQRQHFCQKRFACGHIDQNQALMR